MAFIKKRKINGILYYALVEKVKREDGTFGIRQLKSFGRKLPLEYMKPSSNNGRVYLSNINQ